MEFTGKVAGRLPWEKSMRELPELPNLNQLRHQARELQHVADPPITLSAAQLALARQYGFASWPKLKAEVQRRQSRQPITIRPVNSLDELARTEALIAAQFPPRRSTPSHGPDVFRSRFDDDRRLMLVAMRGDQIVGGALALQVGDAVKVDVIALEPKARGLGVGRRLMQGIELEAIRLGARVIYLGGAHKANRGFYWRLGFHGRKSLMQKGLRLPRYARNH
jgi:GNAT superfamily N-acetyltransferase